jgi:phosphatidylserine decarboxylase
MLSDALTSPPKWNQDSHPGLTINDIVSSIVTTDFGFATFLNPKVNAAFKKILDAWTRYLATPDSTSALTPEGWLSENAMEKLTQYLDLPSGGTPTERFKEAFVRPSPFPQKAWGFQSWDNFFARRFVDINTTRPLPKKDDPNVIVSPCESTIYNIDRKAQETGEFWLKGNTYSLRMMLNDDEFAPLFYGGTVYQAFLDVWDYHRWHSPVNGIVRKIVNVSGTYYAIPPDFYKGLDTITEVQGIVEAQAFLAVAATRALIFIESDNPDIGLLCFIGVGMIDVSSCEITVRAGDRVAKGDQIGSFHFGGSTSCLVFQPGLHFDLDSQWNDPAITPPKDASHVPIRAQLGTLKKVGLIPTN